MQMEQSQESQKSAASVSLCSLIYYFAVVFMSMLLLSAVMLIVRALILVMLGLASQKLAILYICFDMGLYLLFKIVRGDFFYWLPLNGFLEIIVSLIMRIASKVIVEYTSNGESSKKSMNHEKHGND